MVRKFSLAGLLRLRQIQEEQAATDLAAAEARMRETSTARARVRGGLSTTSSEISDIRGFNAVIAARSSARRMLADLDVVAEIHQTELGEAQSGFAAARAQSIALEKLEARHNDEVRAEESRAEQRVLDEIAGAAWARNLEREIS